MQFSGNTFWSTDDSGASICTPVLPISDWMRWSTTIYRLQYCTRRKQQCDVTLRSHWIQNVTLHILRLSLHELGEIDYRATRRPIAIWNCLYTPQTKHLILHSSFLVTAALKRSRHRSLYSSDMKATAWNYLANLCSIMGVVYPSFSNSTLSHLSYGSCICEESKCSNSLTYLLI